MSRPAIWKTPGQFPKDQHRHGGVHEHAQLHERGGQHQAVTGDVPLEQQKAAQMHCTANQSHPRGEGNALLGEGAVSVKDAAGTAHIR